jgi:hypothetical protein
MTTTMNLIARQTVGAGGAASVTFSNIPQTFTDLKVVASTRSTYSNPFDVLIVYFNGSTANGSMIELFGYNGTTGSNPASNIRIGYNSGNTATANTFGSGELYIPNYTSSNNKSASADGVGENNSALAVTGMNANLWSSTAAITSMTFNALNGNLMEFSEFSLYGISNSTTTQNTTTPSASGGDIITTDGSFWYHTFLYSGTFVPLKNLTCDYLVVAGGGGGGCNVAGGGGAGGLRSTVTATGGGGSLETPLSLLANTAYTTTIGAGGIGGAGSDLTPGSDGNNSVFATITSIGGGGGGTFTTNVNGRSGGSGGGGAAGSTTGGSRTTGQGFVGGNGGTFSGGNYPAGGGGGAGAVGSNGTNNGAAGNGGNGVATSISGTSVTYAGGGGGGTATGTVGTGGTGGGGNGRNESVAGTAGTVNTGGGGGGGNQPSSSRGGYQGGSGIVIVRYAV